MSKKCPRCESKDVHITEYPAPTDNMATCYGCGYADLADRFPEQTIFDYITTSPEELAPKLVCKTAIRVSKTVNDYYGRGIGVRYDIEEVWKSTITEDTYMSETEAIAATVKKLKGTKDEQKQS